MSGPKVVCIVTREELVALCRNLLALVEEAAARLRTMAQRLGVQEDLVVTELEERQHQLQQMLAEDRFVELQKAAPAAVAFLEGEQARLETAAVERCEARRRRGQRLAAAAQSVIDALAAAGTPPDSELLKVRAQACGARKDELAAMQATVEAALRRLAPQAAASSAFSLELVRRLASGLGAQSFTEWLANQGDTIKSAVDARLERLLAEVQTLNDPAAAAPYLARAAALDGETSYARRALLTDSLMLDLARFRRERAEQEAWAAKLRQARAALAALDAPEVAAMVQRLEVVIADGGRDDRLADEALRLVDTLMRRRAGDARRRAVLEGLAALGYEVREGMTTAWAADGRIVVRKPGATDYGIELGAPPDAGRMQVRVVRDAASVADLSRDRDAETVWCAELDRLRALLADAGNELAVERAMEPGAQPLKSVVLVDMPRRRSAMLPSKLQRATS